MNADKYHPSMMPLEEACLLAQSDWICVKNPLTGWSREGTLPWKTGVLLRHFTLVARCWRASGHRHILVREFSTLPLLAVFPLLWPLRKKIFFLIHHNLQWAMRSRAERFGLIMLARLGIRWAVFETQNLKGFEKFKIPSPRNLLLLHPVPAKTAGEKSKTRLVIGVAGYYRPEKGMDELIRLLIEHFPDCNIVAGIPNPEALRISSVEVICTASDADYRRMLAKCDVIVQNGAKDSYFYRVSGPVADAAACGTAVAAPDFPFLRHQVSAPIPVGEVFQGLAQMPDAVRSAIAKARAGQYDFNAYCIARSAQALAGRLDEFSRRQNG